MCTGINDGVSTPCNPLEQRECGMGVTTFKDMAT